MKHRIPENDEIEEVLLQVAKELAPHEHKTEVWIREACQRLNLNYDHKSDQKPIRKCFDRYDVRQKNGKDTPIKRTRHGYRIKNF